MTNKILTTAKSLLIGLFLAMVACFIVGVIFILYQIQIFNRYYLEREIAEPKFRNANELLAKEIPVPSGVTEYDRSSNPNGYGVALTIEYMRSPNRSSEEVWKDYQQQFLQNGWTEKEQGTTDRRYIKGTACVDISMFENMQKEVSQEYWVTLWYDYRSQPFSPKVPPDWLIEIVTFGEKKVTTCP